jgi:hypothetical protein
MREQLQGGANMCAAVEAGQPPSCSTGLRSGSGLVHRESAGSRSEQLILASCSTAPRFCQVLGRSYCLSRTPHVNGGVISRQAKLALLMMDV